MLSSQISPGGTLRVAIATPGRFHHFDLARELERQGMLEAIFTGYPAWKLRREALPPEKIRSFPWLQLLALGCERQPVRCAPMERELSWRALRALDRHVSRHLPPCQVLVCASSVGFASGLAAQKMGVKYVCDRGSAHIGVQDQLLREEFQRWRLPYFGIDKRIMRQEDKEYSLADAITVPSTFARRTFLEKGLPAEKVRVIPYGSDLKRFAPQGEPNAGGFQIVFVGGVSLRKGIPYLLEAFREVRHPNKRLVLAGTLMPEMRRWMRERVCLLEGVELAGPLPRESLAALFSRSHVLALPSIEDGFGLVIAEAMACGCPVIGTTHTGAPDLVQDGVEGLIVPPGDSQALAQALERLAQDEPLRAQMAAAARRKMLGAQGWQTYGNAYANLCSTLAGEEALRTAETGGGHA